MEEKTCYIFGAGEYFGDEGIGDNAFVMAADAGITACRERDIVPDVIIGDFDSLGHLPHAENVIKLPVIKDDTDTLAAVRHGLEHGFGRFVFFGCTGGRLSHTLANVQTLNFLAKRGAIGFLHDKCEVLTATCKGMNFDSRHRGFLSVFAAESSAVISESGLKYTVEAQKITAAFPLGVSNEFIGQKAAVSIHTGTALLAIQKQDDKELQKLYR